MIGLTKPFRCVPAWIAVGVILAVCLLRLARLDFIERVECITYDLRVRHAAASASNVATNLGFIFIDEDSVKQVWNGSLGYSFGLYWPRQVYGRLVDELSAQGAKAVAFDIIFGELRPDHPPVQIADATLVESDEFFAEKLRQGSNTVIAITTEVVPPLLFLTNAAARGDITTEKDSDGILRRARAFRVFRQWHPAFLQMEADPDYGVDLRRARVAPREIILPRQGLEDIRIPLDSEGRFSVADFWGEKLPAGMPRTAQPFVEQLAWHLGIVLASRELGLNLERAQIDLSRGVIVLSGPEGISRTIPVDREGRFYIDWSLPLEHPQLATQPIQELLIQNRLRLEGWTTGLSQLWHGKLAVVGSSAVLGNNLTDRGATPIRSDTLLASKHWNVASSIITGRFVRRASLGTECVLILMMGAIAGLATWRLRVLAASAVVGLVLAGYAVAALIVYDHARYWLPVALPLGGALLVTHLLLVTWRVVFEQAERRRVKSVFSTIVSPKIVNELLQTENLSLGGARREITVLFADIRGFTAFTDEGERRAGEQVRAGGLTGMDAEACFDLQARETLETINLYLGLAADIVIAHEGTLDKFIGDCVMAFWGAPAGSSTHASACVRAAIEVQRAVHELNLRRAEENKSRERQNLERKAAGQPPLPLLPVLALGTGINTGMATVGLMGSEAKTRNYTVFGREVNLASRLEALSGHGKIYISAATWQHLHRDDPALAQRCTPLPPLAVKGFQDAIEFYEVAWQKAGAPAA